MAGEEVDQIGEQAGSKAAEFLKLLLQEIYNQVKNRANPTVSSKTGQRFDFGTTIDLPANAVSELKAQLKAHGIDFGMRKNANGTTSVFMHGAEQSSFERGLTNVMDKLTQHPEMFENNSKRAPTKAEANAYATEKQAKRTAEKTVQKSNVKSQTKAKSPSSPKI
ncbi:MAG: DUF3801 domain-containing protein [Streptococcaceae bacterium]|jgi:hypothetical protein|nr:DUF3801 domain-containing protein [Streptococcaceae bacterium]